MAEGIVNKHQKAGWVVAKFHDSGFVTLNNANTVIGANTAGETVRALNIISAAWTVSNGTFTVARGTNTALILTEGQHDFALEDGRLIDNVGGDPQSNVVVTLSAGATGTLILKLHKRSEIAGGSIY
jgi:hypothetical protein